MNARSYHHYMVGVDILPARPSPHSYQKKEKSKCLFTPAPNLTRVMVKSFLTRIARRGLIALSRKGLD